MAQDRLEDPTRGQGAAARAQGLTWEGIVNAARPVIGDKCRACLVCDGRACGNSIPGPGAKGTGVVARRNYDAWQHVMLVMDTLVGEDDIDTSCEMFGRTLSYPVFIGPVGDVNRHYGPSIDTLGYNRLSLRAAKAQGVAAFTGDGVPDELFEASCAAIGEVGGTGVPTVKPWSLETCARKISVARSCSPIAIAMDVDAAGLPFLKGLEPPAGPKSPEELASIVSSCEGVPFIVKGVMSVRGAIKAAQAGASAVVVSNHGGRVLDGCSATAWVLPQVARAVHERFPGVKVLVDGGIRSGVDVFRALALGADATLVCRPFVTAAYGAGQDGIEFLLTKLRDELADAMMMCGARRVADICADMIEAPTSEGGR
ncbi:MAG: alpha-hydroxy-acid oxidizing protein [Coriobacteriales bacterium]|jgi:4-hydroxymandelate oxidase